MTYMKYCQENVYMKMIGTDFSQSEQAIKCRQWNQWSSSEYVINEGDRLPDNNSIKLHVYKKHEYAQQ